MLQILKLLGLTPGFYTELFCDKKDTTRIIKMKRKMSVEGKADRKRKRAVRKGFTDKNQENEGEVYATGSF